MKKYQISSMAHIMADGWVEAKNIEEAKKKWRGFVFSEMRGTDIGDVRISEVISPKNKYYDKDNIPKQSEFEETKENCVTYNHLN